jgi:hypothetical protein
VLTETIPGVLKLAVSDRWLVYRTAREIRVQSLSDTTRSALVARAGRAVTLGRPALGVDVVVYHHATKLGSRLTAVNVAAGTRFTARSDREALLLNPSLLAGKLLYVRASRCSQQLRLGPLRGGRERVLYELGPLAGQDPGSEPRHTRQGGRVPCANRPKPTKKILWTTALSPTTAYVTVLRPVRGGSTVPTLLAIPRS